MSTIVLRRELRTSVRSGVLWGVLLGAVVASSATTYQSLYRTAPQRRALAAAFGSNSATSALFGPAPGLDTVAGFTAFKSLLTIMVLAAVWGLLMSTRLLRGEEEAGRWELLLLGGTGQRRAVGEVLAALGAGVASMWVLCTLLLAVAGRRSGVGITAWSAAYFALAALSPAAMFAAVGGLASQLAPTRRQAAAYGAWFLGASYALRLVADAGIGLHALVWISPLGWVEQLRPLTGARPHALLPIAAFTAAVGALAVQLAGRRDVGAGLLPDRSHRPARTRLLSNPTALAARLNRPAVLGWWAALAVTGLLLGLVARAAGSSMGGSSVTTVFARLGVPGADARSFLGVAFLVVTVLVAFLAAGQLVAAAHEEADGRVEHLLAAPVSRSSWLFGRAIVALVAVIGGALLAGFAVWLGGLAEGGAVDLWALVGAGANAVPPAVFLLGVGFLVLGAWPVATSAAVYGLLAWSLLVEVAGGFGSANRWLLDTSLFHQISAAPAVQPNWTVGASLVAIGMVAAAAGTLALRQRDLRVL